MSLADDIEEADIPEYPKMEYRHQAVSCGDHKDRWEERRDVLIAQRGFRLEQLRLVKALKKRGVANMVNMDRLERPIDVLSLKIEECNRIIDSLSGKKSLKQREIKKLVG